MSHIIEFILKSFGFIFDPIFRIMAARRKAYKVVDGNDGSVYFTDDYAVAVERLTRASCGIIYDNRTGTVIISQ